MKRKVMIDQAKVRVLCLESIHADAVARLEAEGYQVESVRTALDEAELIERIEGVHLLGIRSKTQVTAKVLEAADSLVAIGAFSIGTAQIHLPAAAARGIAVFNAPFSNTRSVVELAVAEIIALTRRLTGEKALLHQGECDKAPAGHAPFLRRRPVPPDAPGQHLPHPVPRHRGRPRGAARGAGERSPGRRGG